MLVVGIVLPMSFVRYEVSQGAIRVAVVAAMFTWVGLCTSAAIAAERGNLFDTWHLNAQLSAELQPDNSKSKDGNDGLNMPWVSVGGVGIPLPSGGSAPQSAGAAGVSPDVLSCTELKIERIDAQVVLTYVGVGEEALIKGEEHGVKTGWSSRKLTSKYSTTRRKVSKTFEVDKGDRLIVTVKLSPKQGKGNTFKRVFERASRVVDPSTS
jgi:hypothetical protein